MPRIIGRKEEFVGLTRKFVSLTDKIPSEQGTCEFVHAIGTLCTLLQGAYMFTGEDGLDSNLLEIDKKKATPEIETDTLFCPQGLHTHK